MLLEIIYCICITSSIHLKCCIGCSFTPVKKYLFMPKPYFEHLIFSLVTFFHNHWNVYSNSTNILKPLNKKFNNSYDKSTKI